jgi:hopanoid biosynthesis associated protein HpnK
VEEPRKRLVVVADDLGRSPGVNRAIAEAVATGIVTAASLMAGGEAFDGALEVARRQPRLAVGLHATFCDGRAVLPRSLVPGLVDETGRLETNPARAGVRYWSRRKELIPQIEAEAEAQFERLAAAGVAPTHVDGHHHLHIHPLLFRILCRIAARRGVRWVRIPQGDPAPGRILEWATFGILARLNRRVAAHHGMMSARRVAGLARTGRLDERYLLELIPRIGAGWNEIFAHPNLDTEAGRRELDALTSPRVRARLESSGIALSSYGEEGN